MTDKQILALCLFCSFLGLAIIFYANSIYRAPVKELGTVMENDEGKSVTVGGVVSDRHFTGEHLFLEIRDDTGEIKAVLFEGTMKKLGLNPNRIKSGMEIGLTGQIEKYEGEIEVIAEKVYLE